MTVTRIHSDGRRVVYEDQPAPAEVCTDISEEQAKRESSWRFADAAVWLIAAFCVIGYFAGVFA